MFGVIPGPKIGDAEPFYEHVYKELSEIEKGFDMEVDGIVRKVRIVLVLSTGLCMYQFHN